MLISRLKHRGRDEMPAALAKRFGKRGRKFDAGKLHRANPGRARREARFDHASGA